MLHGRQIFGISTTAWSTRRVWHAFSSPYKSEVYDKHEFIRGLKQVFFQRGMPLQMARYHTTLYLWR